MKTDPEIANFAFLGRFLGMHGSLCSCTRVALEHHVEGTDEKSATCDHSSIPAALHVARDAIFASIKRPHVVTVFRFCD
jgi:hypothetical protein